MDRIFMSDSYRDRNVMDRDIFGKMMFVCIASICAGIITGATLVYTSLKRIPHEGTMGVQAGYVSPSKLEIGLQDLDQNGEDETIMKYDGESYLLRLDKYGRPKVQDYKLGPADEIVAVELEGADYYNVPMP